MAKFKYFSNPLSVFQVLFKGKFYFQGLFKAVLHIQLLFKPVSFGSFDVPVASWAEPDISRVFSNIIDSPYRLNKKLSYQIQTRLLFLEFSLPQN